MYFKENTIIIPYDILYMVYNTHKYRSIGRKQQFRRVNYGLFLYP